MKLFSSPIDKALTHACFHVYDVPGTYVGAVWQTYENGRWDAFYCQFPGYGAADTDFADKPSAVEWLRGKHAKNR